MESTTTPLVPMIARLTVFLGLLALVGCASTPPPSWLGERPAAYANERWVVAVGHGSDAAAAEAAARAEVVRQTNEETAPATLAETWIDPKTGVHWAMVTLDRAPIRERLFADRAAIGEQIVAKLEIAKTAPPEQALGELGQALHLASERKALDERLAKLGASDASASAYPERAEIEQRLAEVKDLLPIRIESHEMHPESGEIGEPLDHTRRALAQKVIELGFPVSDSEQAWGDDATWLIVQSRLALDRLYLLERDRFVAVRWDAAVEIKDLADNGEVVAVLTEEGRSTHLNEHEARRLALEDAAEFAARALDDWLATRIGAPSDSR